MTKQSNAMNCGCKCLLGLGCRLVYVWAIIVVQKNLMFANVCKWCEEKNGRILILSAVCWFLRGTSISMSWYWYHCLDIDINVLILILILRELILSAACSFLALPPNNDRHAICVRVCVNCIFQLYLSTVIVNCIYQLYLSTVFVNCICQLYL